MRKLLGITCLILGFVCLTGSVGLALYNRWEDENAKASSQSFVETARLALQEQALSKPQDSTDVGTDPTPSVPSAPDVVADPTMPTIPVKGYECIGILSIPVLELELPIFTSWTYEKLKVAPCHYYGSYVTEDLVIAGHNYKSHFGRFSELKAKDLILFTDAAGKVHSYEVALVETLPGNATLEMINSGFELTLYTCTKGGANRVTVRCSAVD